MFAKVTSIAPLTDYVLLVGFSNGEYKQFDLKPVMEKYPAFKLLSSDNELYKGVKIDIGGYGIIWNDELDISADGLYEKGEPCKESSKIENSKNLLLQELVNARKSAHLSQKQLEVLSGVAQPCIARTEIGNTDPKLTTLLKMLEPLGLKLSITQISNT